MKFINATNKVNLLNLTRSGMTEFVVSLGEKPFRAQQLLQALHREGITNLDQISNLSKAFRAKLVDQAEVLLPDIILEKLSADGTCKWLLKVDGGNAIEMVFIPEEGRGTLCVSSQVGCGLNCSFCSTAQQGFNRNLTTAEIIAQVFIAARRFKITNVVMMGMGEPLLNFEAVLAAMELMQDDFAYGLSKHRVTLSTSGVVPEIYRLAEVSEVALAISLHAPEDELRNVLVPINRKYPIAVLLEACRHYFSEERRRKVMFEYVMLEGVNDSDAQAKKLVKILEGLRCKVNLIPFNPFPNTPYRCSSRERIEKFRDILYKAGIVTTIRKTRGEDVDAACGQLAGQVLDRTKRSRKRLIAIRAENHLATLAG